MPRENKSRYAVLGMLSVHSMSGYDIKKQIEKGIGNFWSEGYAQIYPILKQLEEEGLAICEVERQEGKPDRKVYTITETGRAVFMRWLTEPIGQYPMRIEVLLKLFFAHHADPAISIQHVKRFQQEMEKTFADYKAQEREGEALMKEGGERARYQRMAIRFGLYYSEALLAWCEETITELKRMEDRQGEAGCKRTLYSEISKSTE
ncbi:PadR family transcriptional regulator [Brevibacillus fluminis]|uniref:PadR family transcriptional regulator n=1 Tax=Brevibacillus fluminis TaxID=511487 RepID=UPI003F8B7DAC